MERGERRVRAICNIATKVEFLINLIPTAATCSVQLFMSKVRKMDRKYLISTYKQSGKRFCWLKNEFCFKALVKKLCVLVFRNAKTFFNQYIRHNSFRFSLYQRKSHSKFIPFHVHRFIRGLLLICRLHQFPLLHCTETVLLTNKVKFKGEIKNVHLFTLKGNHF